MSRPSTFVPPACARAERLHTARGEFAVLDARPAGPQKGTALLLPGYTGSKEDFIALLEPLTRDGFRAVAVDGRGQYETPGPDDVSAYAQGELARDVLAQAAALGASAAPLHLVGHSMGGQVARAAVLLDAAPFRSLTLLSSGPARVSASQQERVSLLIDALAVLDMGQVWDAIQSLEPPEETDVPESSRADDAADLRRRWLHHNPAQLTATGSRLKEEPDRVDELADVSLPFQVISGEEDDTWPVPLFDAMAVRLGADRTVIEGAGHSPNTDRPAETALALTEFWNRH